jgi:amino-acid N-acetyltransferase
MTNKPAGRVGPERCDSLDEDRNTPHTTAVAGPLLETRPAAESDRAAVSALLAQAKLALLDEGAQFGEQYVVATDISGHLIGVAGVEVYDGVGLLRSVVVANQARSRGLGEQLFLDRLIWAQKRGISQLFLLTTDARSYWVRHGFQEIDRGQVPASVRASSQWNGGCSASAVAMVRSVIDAD